MCSLRGLVATRALGKDEVAIGLQSSLPFRQFFNVKLVEMLAWGLLWTKVKSAPSYCWKCCWYGHTSQLATIGSTISSNYSPETRRIAANSNALARRAVCGALLLQELLVWTKWPVDFSWVSHLDKLFTRDSFLLMKLQSALPSFYTSSWYGRKLNEGKLAVPQSCWQCEG